MNKQQQPSLFRLLTTVQNAESPDIHINRPRARGANSQNFSWPNQDIGNLANLLCRVHHILGVLIKSDRKFVHCHNLRIFFSGWQTIAIRNLRTANAKCSNNNIYIYIYIYIYIHFWKILIFSYMKFDCKNSLVTNGLLLSVVILKQY
jgi:hypothetical protein